MLTAAARKPSSRQESRSRPEVDALDERVLGDDEAVRRAGRRRARCPRSARATRARAAARARRPQRASSTTARSASISATALITATPAAPARMHSAAFDASMPPIATTGIETERQTSRSPSSPIGGARVRLRRRRPDRAGAEVGRARELRHRALAPRRHRDPERDPRLARPLDPGVALAEMDAGPELERRVDVVVDDQLGGEPVERPSERDDLRGRRALQPQLHDRRAAGRRAPRALLVRRRARAASSRSRPSPAPVSVAGSRAASAS